MATTSSLISISSSFITKPKLNNSVFKLTNNININKKKKLVCFRIQAAKLPTGVELPKVEPNFEAPFLGFTKTAEVWNSRACMIGLIGTFIVELIINKGILQVIGIDIGKGRVRERIGRRQQGPPSPDLARALIYIDLTRAIRSTREKVVAAHTQRQRARLAKPSDQNCQASARATTTTDKNAT
ncbi:hypothetical protein ACFE04_020305 [Oxalis oulophora]